MSKLVSLDDILKKSKTVSDMVTALRECKQPDIKTEHFFSGGMYNRVFYPKKDTFVVGKIHRYAGFNYLVKGAVTIYDGDEVRHVVAPAMFKSKGNDQKVGYFTEDSEFHFVCTCFATTVDEAEKELYYHDDIPIELVKDWEHYHDMLILTSKTEDQIQEYVTLENVILGTLKDFELKDSFIHGTGFFTTRSYKQDDLIGAGLLNGQRTELGRWANDSHSPNAYYTSIDKNNGEVYATRNIEDGEEITMSYIDNLINQKELL